MPQPDPNTLHARTQRIADAVASTWARAHRSGRIDVPLSVVAAYTMAQPADPSGPSLIDSLASVTAQHHQRIIRDLYNEIVRDRPELTGVLYPLIAWTTENDPPADAALDVARAAAKTGLWDITLTDARHEIDLLGHVLSVLRADAGPKRAAIYTPPDIADLMGHMLTPEPGTSVFEPALGTGAMWRGAAQAMRAAGYDPATVTWVGADPDPLAVGAAAVNAVLWGLGPNVVLAVADTLSDRDWPTKAAAQQAELRAIADAASTLTALVALTEPHTKTSTNEHDPNQT